MNNIQLLSAIKQLQDSLPPQVLLQAPIFFTDALNRFAPIHLEWINSWDAFFAVLAIRFKDRGHGKVKRKEFVLQNRGTQRMIDFVRPLELCVRPGQKLDMSMVFREVQGVVSRNECPRCHEPSSGAAEDEVKWYVRPNPDRYVLTFEVRNANVASVGSKSWRNHERQL